MKSAAAVALANLEVLETQNALGDFDDKWKSYDPTKDYEKACSDTVKNVAFQTLTTGLTTANWPMFVKATGFASNIRTVVIGPGTLPAPP